VTLLSVVPASLDVENAKLPAIYEAARSAIAECARIDECRNWANKAEALASYARQSNDHTLRRYCDRIQARAIQRCGELLRQIPDNNRGRPANVIHEGALTNLTRSAAAREAGLSDHQRVTALRVANVPRPEFEAAVESHNPPTVTQLAERGKQTRRPQPTDHLAGRDPADFQQATSLIGMTEGFVRRAAEIDFASALRGLAPHEITQVRKNLAGIRQWLVAAEGGLNGLQS